MNSSLRNKLILSYLAIALLTAGLIFAFIRVSAASRFRMLVLDQQVSALQVNLARWYAQNGNSWHGFDPTFIIPPQRDFGPNQPRPRSSIEGRHGVVDNNWQILIPFKTLNIGETASAEWRAEATPIMVDGESVGWVLPDDAVSVVLSPDEQVFLQFIDRALLIAAAVAVGIALLTALFLARLIIRPITALTHASEQMALGDLKQEVAIRSQDELGRLAKSFNTMSQQISLSNERRRNLTAAIAHDLGTPLHIISGYVELIQDGTMAATPERMGVIATELEQIDHLIQDLDVLALTDTKNLEVYLEPVSLEQYLPRFIHAFDQRAAAKAIDLTLRICSSPLPLVQIDQDRMAQVIGNLLNNALRYTPEGGKIQVVAAETATGVQIEVLDNGIGISKEDLPFIFDRFYQADMSRGERGKRGLGLAISKGLIQAMGGTIGAESKGLQAGARFILQLPRL